MPEVAPLPHLAIGTKEWAVSHRVAMEGTEGPSPHFLADSALGSQQAPQLVSLQALPLPTLPTPHPVPFIPTEAPGLSLALSSPVAWSTLAQYHRHFSCKKQKHPSRAALGAPGPTAGRSSPALKSGSPASSSGLHPTWLGAWPGVMSSLPWSSQAPIPGTVMEHHRLGGFNSGKVFSDGPRGCRAQTRGQPVCFLVRTPFPAGRRPPVLCGLSAGPVQADGGPSGASPSSHKDTGPIGLRPLSMASFHPNFLPKVFSLNSHTRAESFNL